MRSVVFQSAQLCYIVVPTARVITFIYVLVTKAQFLKVVVC